MPSKTFTADAVLFDMDGTLTDSIAAVEAAWGKVATDLGLDPVYVIAATHGKRGIDNLAHFKPHIKAHEMDAEVEAFESMILEFADAYHKHGLGRVPCLQLNGCAMVEDENELSGYSTPEMASDGSSSASSSRSSFSHTFPNIRRSDFAAHLRQRLNLVTPQPIAHPEEPAITLADTVEAIPCMDIEAAQKDAREAWQIEAAAVDRSVRILPGVRKMLDSLPDGRYAVATSGAKTYAYGAMTRVGITPPPVTITADDKRLKNGKPFPDPFLLAAKCLGFDASRCVVFEDSPSGIKAGVASGATVIAVCTSHPREKIEDCGAHYIVPNMESVKCEVMIGGDGEMQLQFSVES